MKIRPLKKNDGNCSTEEEKRGPRWRWIDDIKDWHMMMKTQKRERWEKWEIYIVKIVGHHTELQKQCISQTCRPVQGGSARVVHRTTVKFHTILAGKACLHLRHIIVSQAGYSFSRIMCPLRFCEMHIKWVITFTRLLVRLMAVSCCRDSTSFLVHLCLCYLRGTDTMKSLFMQAPTVMDHGSQASIKMTRLKVKHLWNVGTTPQTILVSWTPVFQQQHKIKILEVVYVTSIIESQSWNIIFHSEIII